jgi:hypothetical protein
LYLGSSVEGMGGRINEHLGKIGVPWARNGGRYKKDPNWERLASHADTAVVPIEFDYERDWYWPLALERLLIHELKPPLTVKEQAIGGTTPHGRLNL